MENKTVTMSVAVLSIIVALLIGYIGGTTLQESDSGCDMDMMDMHDDSMGMMGGNGMHDELVASDGAMQHSMEEMMRELRGKEGAEFEEAFLKGMIVHHLGAIDMAEELEKQTTRPELLRMADDIITAQTREVEMMRGWLEAWF